MLKHPSKYSLEEIEKDIWESLKKGTQVNKDDFHTGTIATMGLEGEIQQRTVVLRKVFPSEQTLVFHTDKRSQKVLEINNNPFVSFLFYNRKQQVQLRFEGEATLHHQDELAESTWQNTSIGSRKVYLSEKTPREILTHWEDGIPEELKTKRLSLEETEQGKINFSVVKIKVIRLDWLSLHSEGHARAIFEWIPEKKSYWVAP